MQLLRVHGASPTHIVPKIDKIIIGSIPDAPGKVTFMITVPQFVRKSATSSVGQKCLNVACPWTKINGRCCRGKMFDTILDWEHDLPEKDLKLADYHSSMADLSICLGTTLQIVPSGNLPLYTKKYGLGRIVICNLQPTKHDKKADMILNTYVDNVMVKLLENLDLKLPSYDVKNDPTKRSGLISWTVLDSNVKKMQQIYQTQFVGTKRKTTSDNGKIKLVKKENIFNETCDG